VPFGRLPVVEPDAGIHSVTDRCKRPWFGATQPQSKSPMAGFTLRNQPVGLLKEQHNRFVTQTKSRMAGFTLFEQQNPYAIFLKLKSLDSS
jgi:hypothetical protein